MYLLKINLKKLQTYDSSLFTGQSYFNNNGAQSYLIFQPLYYTLKILGDIEQTVSSKPKVWQMSLLILLLLMIVFLHQLSGTKIQSFV